MTKFNDAFCMMPFIHLHMTPVGVTAPCCISKSCSSPNPSVDGNKLMDFVNSPSMRELRVDMLQGKQNNECASCYLHEKNNVFSARNSFNSRFEKYYDEVVSAVQPDGSMEDFKMRYFDIRFSNICNFKCRTCGPVYSSQWENEDVRAGIMPKPLPKPNITQILSDVVNQIPNLESAYFAGGEPLITEEHYILLEEMIKQGRTDIALAYNTNLSNLTFKDKDLISLWSHFKRKIDVYASIDHYGERAEYIRSGTDWAKIETNFNIVNTMPNVNLCVNTVLSVFNYTTLGDFYQYLIDSKWYNPKSMLYSLYKMTGPDYLTSQVLPENIKPIGKEQIESLLGRMKNGGFTNTYRSHIEEAIAWTESKHIWDLVKDKFRKEIIRVDSLRNEKFTDTFPELRELIND